MGSLGGEEMGGVERGGRYWVCVRRLRRSWVEMGSIGGGGNNRGWRWRGTSRCEWGRLRRLLSVDVLAYPIPGPLKGRSSQPREGKKDTQEPRSILVFFFLSQSKDTLYTRVTHSLLTLGQSSSLCVGDWLVGWWRLYHISYFTLPVRRRTDYVHSSNHSHRLYKYVYSNKLVYGSNFQYSFHWQEHSLYEYRAKTIGVTSVNFFMFTFLLAAVTRTLERTAMTTLTGSYVQRWIKE